MGIINRFILFLYTLFFAVLSLGAGALVLHVVPEHAVWNEFQYAAAQWQTGAAAAHSPRAVRQKSPIPHGQAHPDAAAC